jgi:P-type Cu2+ transporter
MAKTQDNSPKASLNDEDLQKTNRVINHKTIRKQFPITGMSCASCSVNVESTLRKQRGIVKASVNLVSQGATVEFDPSVIQPQDLKEAVVSIGYDLIIEESDRSKEELENLQQKRYSYAEQDNMDNICVKRKECFQILSLLETLKRN